MNKTHSEQAHLRLIRLALLSSMASLLWACSPIASVEEVSPLPPAPVAGKDPGAELSKAQELDEAAAKVVKTDPHEAMADDEVALRLALDTAASLPPNKEEDAIALYNYSVARLLEATLQSGEKPWLHQVEVSGPEGPVYLAIEDDTNGAWRPVEDELVATDRLQIGGTYFAQRAVVDGVGMPLVSKGAGRPGPWCPDTHYYGVTAVAHVSGSHCTIQILDPARTEIIPLAGETRPVAADFSAPMAMGISEVAPQKFGVLALLRTDRYMDAEKMIMVEPYRDNRQPLILIHGLFDSPASWTPMINALYANPAIRRRYQIWTYRYPSGLPFPLSAELLRQEIAAIYKKYPQTPQAILIGHSMGGLLAHMLMCDSGDQFCIDSLGKPLSQFKIEPDEYKMLEGAFYFKKSPYVAEAIFMATPHRGAELASNPVGRLGASLIHLPVTMVTLGPKLISQMGQTEGEDIIDRFPNSIDTLRPESPEVKALADLKIPHSIPYYSIIGDRGRGDSPHSSDGVVPYESSHLEGAQTELIVPSDHTVQQNPQAIAEVQRILLKP